MIYRPENITGNQKKQMKVGESVEEVSAIIP